MSVLVLDTRALEVAANPAADLRAARRVQSMLTSAARLGIPVRVPAAVLAEAYRGTPADAAVDRVLGAGIRPITMGQSMARAAGRRHRGCLALTVSPAYFSAGGEACGLMNLARSVPRFLIHLFWLLVAIVLILVAALVVHHFGGFSLSFHIGDFSFNLGVS